MSHVSSRVAAVGLGVVAAGLVASPAFAATPAAKPTSLTLHAAHASVAPKHKDTLTARLENGKVPVAGARVYLVERVIGGKWGAAVAIKPLTNAKGQVTITVVPGNHKGQKDQFMVVFKGNAKYKASHSHVITVTVG